MTLKPLPFLANASHDSMISANQLAEHPIAQHDKGAGEIGHFEPSVFECGYGTEDMLRAN